MSVAQKYNKIESLIITDVVVIMLFYVDSGKFSLPLMLTIEIVMFSFI